MAQSTKLKTPSLIWIYAWIVASTLPILPYATPLWSAAFADTPYAYLMWIPVFAFTWAGWTLRRALSYTDDAELNGIMGLPVLIISASLLISGMHAWAYYFVGQSAGLLIWPLWALGMAWLMFGVGVTGYIIRPLSYLWLTWPPLYSAIINVTNPILEDLSNRSVTLMTHFFHGLQTGPSVGTYNVFYGLHQEITVYVTSVCSGADSLLAIVILFPIILVTFIGSIYKKVLLVLLAALLSLLANVIRLGLIIASVHYFGPNFALGILHPILGIVLFAAMVLIVVHFAHRLGLTNRQFQRSPYLRRPGTFRFSVSMLAFGALTFLLWPLYQGTPGSVQSPLTVRTDVLSNLMPNILGWQKSLVGNYDASTLLGPGSKSTAMTYQTPMGNYALVELWWTYQPISLLGYEENNCLLFHGSQILYSDSVQLNNNVQATSFTVLLPPNVLGGPRNLFIDTVYSFMVKYAGRTAYVRVELAAPVLLQVPQNSSLLTDIPSAVNQLWLFTERQIKPIYPLNPDQTVFVHNYMVFTHQFTNALLPHLKGA